MKHLSRIFSSAVAITYSAFVWAGPGPKVPAPGPEFGEGSLGLLALGISGVAYLAYRIKNKK